MLRPRPQWSPPRVPAVGCGRGPQPPWVPCQSPFSEPARLAVSSSLFESWFSDRVGCDSDQRSHSNDDQSTLGPSGCSHESSLGVEVPGTLRVPSLRTMRMGPRDFSASSHRDLSVCSQESSLPSWPCESTPYQDPSLLVDPCSCVHPDLHRLLSSWLWSWPRFEGSFASTAPAKLGQAFFSPVLFPSEEAAWSDAEASFAPSFVEPAPLCGP